VTVAIELRGASAGYGGRAVLHDVDLTIRTGERVAIMGRSGAGKSTLVNLIHAQAPDRVALVPQRRRSCGPCPCSTTSIWGGLTVARPCSTSATSPGLPERIVDEVRRVLEFVELSDKIFRAGRRIVGRAAAAHLRRPRAL
jgi:phosphonate transport system ATP-binding protein